MVIAGSSLLILLLGVCYAVKAKEPPMDRDVIRRIRSLGDQARREELLPYE